MKSRGSLFFHAKRLSFLSTLRFRLSVMMAAVIFFFIMMVSAVAAWGSFEREVASQRALLQSAGTAYAAALSSPLEAGTRRDASQILRGTAQIPNIRQAFVRDANGQVFVQMGFGVLLVGRDGDPREMSTLDIWFARQLQAETPILAGGEQIGTLSMLADISDLRAAVLAQLGATARVAFFAILIGAIIAWQLISRLTAPLARLTRLMSTFADDQNADFEQVEGGRDETGILADAFNTMIASIRERDRRIAEHVDTLEDTVEERTKDLRLARDEAEAANAAKSDFLATMSHEIRTPMNGMLVMADMLSAADLTPRHRRYADIIARSGRGLLTIINDILDLSKIESGKLELEHTTLSPDALVADTASLFWERARETELELATYVAPDVPAEILGDVTRIGQVVTNLVNNALKFTETGGVEIRLSSKPMANSERVWMMLEVVDTGIGIPDDKIEHIFDAFAQADQSTTRRFGGTGLGLAVCKRLVTAMDGKISVSSQEGVGSTFRVVWPADISVPVEDTDPFELDVSLRLGEGRMEAALWRALTAYGCTLVQDGGALCIATSDTAEAAARDDLPVVLLSGIGDTRADALLESGTARDILPAPFTRADLTALLTRAQSGRFRGPDALSQSAPTAERPQFSALRVLAADDNAVNREVLREALSMLGVRADFAVDGLEAIEMAGATRYDVILMDGSMPEMDGLEATRRIRANEAGNRRRRAGIFALTAQLAGEGQETWTSAGADGYLTKPFTLDRLEQALASVASPDAIAEERFEIVKPAPKPAEDPPLLDRDVLASMDELRAGPGGVRFKVWKLFAVKAPDGLADLTEALERGKGGADIARLAHAMKSMALTAGAARFAGALQALESAGKDDVAADELARLADIAEDHLADTLEAMEDDIRALAAEAQAS